MTELVAVRTLLKFKLLEKTPSSGSISQEALTKATGVKINSLVRRATDLDMSLLTNDSTDRILRLVVDTVFLDQSATGEYIHTKFSAACIMVPRPGNSSRQCIDFVPTATS
jgi:uncharacterized protein (DUF2384 family)